MPGPRKAPKKTKRRRTAAAAKKRKAQAPTPKGKRRAAAPKPKSTPDNARAKAGERKNRRRNKAKKRARPVGAPRPIPRDRPSDRALAASAQRPIERTPTDEERDALAKVAGTARAYINAVGGPDAVVHRIAAFVDEVRSGVRPEPKSQDIRLGIGALWGEQVREQVGWIWVHLTYPDGFASYAVVPDDRAFACFPLNRVQELMKRDVRSNTSIAIWSAIVAGQLPDPRHVNAYLVIG